MATGRGRRSVPERGPGSQLRGGSRAHAFAYLGAGPGRKACRRRFSGGRLPVDGFHRHDNPLLGVDDLRVLPGIGGPEDLGGIFKMGAAGRGGGRKLHHVFSFPGRGRGAPVFPCCARGPRGAARPGPRRCHLRRAQGASSLPVKSPPFLELQHPIEDPAEPLDRVEVAAMALAPGVVVYPRPPSDEDPRAVGSREEGALRGCLGEICPRAVPER